MSSILNNIAALGASRQLGISGTGLQQTLLRLTTGRRINSARDDAAGLGISNALGMEIRVAAQGRRNANDGVSYLQTADGILDEVTHLLTRAAELAQQARTGTEGQELYIAGALRPADNRRVDVSGRGPRLRDRGQVLRERGAR